MQRSGSQAGSGGDGDVAGSLAEVEDDGRPVPGGAVPPSWGYDHFRALFEQSPIACSLIDLHSRQVYANAAYLALFGYDQPGSPALDATRLTRDDDQERTWREYRQLVAGSIDRIGRRKPYVRADGSHFVGHLDATLLRDEVGQPWAILNVCRDVTDAAEAEERLAQSEARFRALVQNASDAIVVLGVDGRVTYATPSAEHLAGFALDQELGFDALSAVHPDDLDVVAGSFASTSTRPGTASPLQFRIVRPDGQVRLVEAVATNLLDDPTVAGVVINLRDLSDRAEAQNALEISERRFRRMLENISDTVTLVGRDGTTLHSTGNARTLLGADAVLPPSFSYDLVHPDDHELMAPILAELLEAPGRELTSELRVRTSADEWGTIEVTAVNLLEDEAVGAIVVTSRNITARKAAELELAEARDQAVRALEARTEFVASVSHELRTPIHGILGLTELLTTTVDDDERGRRARSVRRATE